MKRTLFAILQNSQSLLALRTAVLLTVVFLVNSLLADVASAQKVGECQVFPSDNPWNQDVSQLPVHPLSDVYVAKINASRTKLHPDFGSNAEYGIPWISVPAGTAMENVVYTAFGDESDPGPMPIPSDAPIESGSDRHVIAIDQGTCKLYELYAAEYSGNSWQAQSGAVFDLTKNSYRPDGWTSADAAGLPIFPGLVRLDECNAGAIEHAIRFTVPQTQRGWIHPARHHAGKPDTNYPPMGLRMRLKADFDISGYSGCARVILTALKKYGMILADNGSAWFITGERNTNWPDDDIYTLKNVPGSAFEAVYTGPIKRQPDQTSAVEPLATTDHLPDLSAEYSAERGSLRVAAHGFARVDELTLHDLLGRTLAKEAAFSDIQEFPISAFGAVFIRASGVDAKGRAVRVQTKVAITNR